MCLHGGGDLEEALDAVNRGQAAANALGLTASDSRWSYEELKVGRKPELIGLWTSPHPQCRMLGSEHVSDLCRGTLSGS